jgi:hypothetical protein
MINVKIKNKDNSLDCEFYNFNNSSLTNLKNILNSGAFSDGNLTILYFAMYRSDLDLIDRSRLPLDCIKNVGTNYQHFISWETDMNVEELFNEIKSNLVKFL